MSFLFVDKGLVEIRSVRNVTEISELISPLCLEPRTKRSLVSWERPFKTVQSSWTLPRVTFNSTSEADIESMLVTFADTN